MNIHNPDTSCKITYKAIYLEQSQLRNNLAMLADNPMNLLAPKFLPDKRGTVAIETLQCGQDLFLNAGNLCQNKVNPGNPFPQCADKLVASYWPRISYGFVNTNC